MAYLDSWKICKRTFEGKAGKKPSEKFLLVFRKSSGMEDVAKGLDTALQKLDPKEIDKATTKYRITSSNYRNLLEAASRQDKGENYNAALTELDRGMDRILTDFLAAADDRFRTKADNLLADAKKLQQSLEEQFYSVGASVVEARTAYEECGRITRLVVSIASLNAAGAKKAAAGLTAPCKTISTIAGRVAKSDAAARKQYDGSLKEFKKSKHLIDLLGGRTFEFATNLSFNLVQNIEDNSHVAQELVSNSKALVVTAAAALRGGFDSKQFMQDSLYMFLERVHRDVSSCNQMVLDRESEFDKVNFAFMNAENQWGKRAAASDKLATESYGKIEKASFDGSGHNAKTISKIEGVQERVDRDFESFDRTVIKGNKETQALYDEISVAIRDFNTSKDKLKELTKKYVKLSGKLKAK